MNGRAKHPSTGSGWTVINLKKKLGIALFIGVVVAALLYGLIGKKVAAAKPEPAGKVVAKVNGAAITEEDLKFRIPGPHGDRKSRGDRQKILDDIIAEELLYQQGLKIGLDKDPAYQAQIARLERQLAHVKRAEMTRRVYNTQVAAKIEITSADARKYFDKNAERIATELHLGVLSFNSKEAAEEALGKIRGGASFEAVARGVTGNQASAGPEPWDLGFLSWDRIPVDFVEAVYRLQPGEVSGVASSKRTGFQIFKLFTARRNPKADFESVSGLIMNRLRDEKMIAAYESYVENLKKDARIERF